MTSPHFKSAFQCFKMTILRDHFWGLYKGMLFPLFSWPICQSIIFGCYNQAYRILDMKDDEPQLGKAFIAGWYAGVTKALVGCPLDLVKMRL